MINEIYLNSMDELIRALNELPNNYIYRGHADSEWTLESTLERILGARWSKELAGRFEDYYLNIFRSKYHIYKKDEHEPKSKLAWLSVMQHYGVPTRLIDFTESPYIALYFALEVYNPQLKKDLAIYAIDYTSIMNSSSQYISNKDSSFLKTKESFKGNPDLLFDDVVDRFAYDVVWITEPQELNARMDRQSGTFLIAGDKEMKIEALLNSATYNKSSIIKYRISNSLYENIYALLRKMNINAKAIYGDLGGLAKSIKMDMQVHLI